MNVISLKTVAALSVLSLSSIGLTGCGYSRGDRALSGAGLGAGVGALGTAIVGGHVLTGAAVGAAAGAAAGAISRADEINLGKPVWKR